MTRALVHVPLPVRRSLGLPAVVRPGLVFDDLSGSWWRIELDGRCEPVARPQHPHLRSSIAALPVTRRTPEAAP